MTNKTLIGIVAGVILLGAVAYGTKPDLFSGACSYKEKSSSCQTACADKAKEAKAEKSGACCASK